MKKSKQTNQSTRRASPVALRHSLSTPKLKTLARMAAFVFIFATVLPAGTIQYTGMDYTTVVGPTYSTSEYVSATFTLTDPLPTNAYEFAPTTLTSWTINDGVNTLSSSTVGTLSFLEFSTDSMGNITDWYFWATDTGLSENIFSGGPVGEGLGTANTDSGVTSPDFAISTPGGAWQDAAPTPEPETFGMLLLTASLLPFATMRRRPGKAFGQA